MIKARYHSRHLLKRWVLTGGFTFLAAWHFCHPGVRAGRTERPDRGDYKGLPVDGPADQSVLRLLGDDPRCDSLVSDILQPIHSENSARAGLHTESVPTRRSRNRRRDARGNRWKYRNHPAYRGNHHRGRGDNIRQRSDPCYPCTGIPHRCRYIDHHWERDDHSAPT